MTGLQRQDDLERGRLCVDTYALHALSVGGAELISWGVLSRKLLWTLVTHAKASVT
jgi:hypothetical protein